MDDRLLSSFSKPGKIMMVDDPAIVSFAPSPHLRPPQNIGLVGLGEEELALPVTELEADECNDDTFGAGAIEDDWENSHERLAEVLPGLGGLGSEYPRSFDDEVGEDIDVDDVDDDEDAFLRPAPSKQSDIDLPFIRQLIEHRILDDDDDDDNDRELKNGQSLRSFIDDVGSPFAFGESSIWASGGFSATPRSNQKITNFFQQAEMAKWSDPAKNMPTTRRLDEIESKLQKRAVLTVEELEREVRASANGASREHGMSPERSPLPHGSPLSKPPAPMAGVVFGGTTVPLPPGPPVPPGPPGPHGLEELPPRPMLPPGFVRMPGFVPPPRMMNPQMMSPQMAQILSAGRGMPPFLAQMPPNSLESQLMREYFIRQQHQQQHQQHHQHHQQQQQQQLQHAKQQQEQKPQENGQLRSAPQQMRETPPLRREHRMVERESRDPNDPYAGIMSKKEKDWVIKIQLLQIHTDKPYLDDYYFTVWSLKKKQKELRDRGLGDNQKEPKLIYPQLSKLENREYTPAVFLGSLGRVVSSSVHHPRELIAIPRQQSPDELAASAEAHGSTRKFRDLLIDVERMFDLLLKMDDIEREMLALPDDAKMPLFNRRVSLSKQLYIRLNLEKPDRLQMLLQVKKGRELLTKALHQLKKELARSVVDLILNRSTLFTRCRSEDISWAELHKAVHRIVTASDSEKLGELFQRLLIQNAATPGPFFKNKFLVSILGSILHTMWHQASHSKGNDAHWKTVLSKLVPIVESVDCDSLAASYSRIPNALVLCERFLDRPVFLRVEKHLRILFIPE